MAGARIGRTNARQFWTSIIFQVKCYLSLKPFFVSVNYIPIIGAALRCLQHWNVFSICHFRVTLFSAILSHGQLQLFHLHIKCTRICYRCAALHLRSIVSASDGAFLSILLFLSKYEHERSCMQFDVEHFIIESRMTSKPCQMQWHPECTNQNHKICIII